jgi:hypothetical protein
LMSLKSSSRFPTGMMILRSIIYLRRNLLMYQWQRTNKVLACSKNLSSDEVGNTYQGHT